MFDIDLAAFPHSYEVEPLDELPGTGRLAAPLLYFPPAKARPEHDGLWLKVRTNSGKSWVAVFAFGCASPPAFSRVVSSPGPDRLCAIASGCAYVVKTDEPEVWDQVPIIPVLDARSVLAHQLLVFSDFTRLAAYGRDGLAWRTPRVCWDGLKITSVTADIIEGVGYDPTGPSLETHFAVDLRTGRSLLPSSGSIDCRLV